MKKLFSFFTMVVLLLATTACSDGGDDDGQVYSFTFQLLNKAISNSNPEDIYVSVSNASVKWTYNNDSRISITVPIAVDESTVVNVSVTDALMEYDSTKGMLVFVAPSAGTGITQLTGYYNPGDYTLYLEFTYNGTHEVTSVAQLSFPYISCSVNDTRNGDEPLKSSNMQIAIAVNPSDMTAKMRIFNFRLANTDASLQYITFNDGLTATATSNGYIITGANLQADDASSYTLNDFIATVTNNGLNIQGTFTANEFFQGTFTGTMFGIVQVEPF